MQSYHGPGNDPGWMFLAKLTQRKKTEYLNTGEPVRARLSFKSTRWRVCEITQLITL